MPDVGFFPAFVRVTHVLNILFMLLLIRSGIQILSAFPRLYFHVDSRPGTEWLTLTRSRVPLADPDLLYREQSNRGEVPRIHTSHEEELDISPWLALPGHRNLGLGRHWHFVTAILWVTNGIVFVVWNFTSGQWRYLIPQSWSLFPTALDDLWTYMHLQLPPDLLGQPFNGAQKLAYFFVIFVLAPLQIATGLAMAPGVSGRFPRYLKPFGGRQMARSLHFLIMVAFIIFIVMHTIMVTWHGLTRELGLIIWGAPERPGWTLAIAFGALAIIILVNWLATDLSLRFPRAVQRVLGLPLNQIIGFTLDRQLSHQDYPASAVTNYFWANGHPPIDLQYQDLARDGFRNWRLEVNGLVEQPLSLSLADLQAMPRQTQVTEHNCIQGWSAVGEWAGVSLSELIARCRPNADAHFVVFYAMDNKGETDGFTGRDATDFYGTINIRYAHDKQTMLAYEFNGKPLTIPHGAPLRLRIETQLGFKMTKWIHAIEFVADYRTIGEGQGGWREDHEYYDPEAGI